MSTNIGIGLTGNFKKTINPIVLNSYKLITSTEDITTVGDFNEFLESESLVNKILRVIQSLDTHASTDPINVDANPLDNIIRSEVINLLNYRKISKIKIQNALDALTEGQDPNLIFNMEESIILLNQAKSLEMINEETYLRLLTTPTPTTLYHEFPDSYKNLLEFQLNLPNNIPTIDELKVAGIVNFIIETIKDNPETVIDENLLRSYTKEYIDDILMTSEFIGYQSAAAILADPEDILSIIGKVAFQNLAKRIMPYLSFITEEKIDIIMDYIPSQYRNITNVFSREQLRLIIDKELDIKNIILKTLSLSEVQNTFNELAAQFKIDFTEAFTEEKLIELITITINNIYPEQNLEEIYVELCSNYNLDTQNLDIISIENRIQNYYN